MAIKFKELEDIENYENLVAATIKESCKWYVKALKNKHKGVKIMQVYGLELTPDEVIKDELLFLRSDLFKEYTYHKVNSERIIQQLNEIAEKEYKN